MTTSEALNGSIRFFSNCYTQPFGRVLRNNGCYFYTRCNFQNNFGIDHAYLDTFYSSFKQVASADLHDFSFVEHLKQQGC